MTFLSKVQTAPAQIGQIIVLAGPEGSGKTTLLSGAPNRLFVPTEIGGAVPNALPLITRWEDLHGLLDEITGAAQAGKFAYKSIAWDSVTAMERLLFDWTVRSDPTYGKNPKLSMVTAHGGYGKAFGVAFEEFAKFLEKIDKLAMFGGIHHIMACHTFVDRVIDTEAGEYDKVDLQLYSPKNSKNYGQRELVRQRADMIGIIHDPVVISKGDKAVLATSLNRGRMLAVDATPAFAAKNRYGMTAPISIPLEGGWNYLADAIFKSKGIDLYNRGN